MKRKTTVQQQLTAKIVSLWNAAMVSVLTLEKLSENAPDTRARARLSALAAGAQAHGSRLLARLSATGGSLLTVPPDDVESVDFITDLRAEAANSRDLAERYAVTANTARKATDPSAAWVCELNRAELLDAAFELGEMANRFLEAAKQTAKEVSK